MLRPISRLPARKITQNLLQAGQRHQRRNIGLTPPAHRSRSWKSSFARWGLAGAGIYWYTNSDLSLFNKEANEHGYIGVEILDSPEETKLPTLDTIMASRKEQKQAALAGGPADPAGQLDPASSPIPGEGSASAEAGPGSPGELEEEAESQGAFNEETGEINWDCPCLGGMAHGPCGEQFRDAFSCFVYSKEEPKGVDCIEKFKTMQDCFRQHPDVYGAELTDDPEDDETAPTPLDEPVAAPAPASAVSANEALAQSATEMSSNIESTIRSDDHPSKANPSATKVADLKPGSGSSSANESRHQDAEAAGQQRTT